MSESGGSQPQDDSDEDIYKDFSDFNFGDELAKLEHSKETIKKEAFDLSEQVKILTKENEELKKSNEILKRNMSSLLKTAQAEVQRKDSMIEELRNKLDSFAFRRKTRTTKDVYTSTQDLEFSVKLKNNKETKASDRKRSNSKDCRTSSDSEKKFHQEEYKKRDSEDDREGSCDNNRKFASLRDCTRRKRKYSDSNHEDFNRRSNERFVKSTNKSQVDYRNSFTENHRGHSKYHSLDRRKRSRSSSRRFSDRRRNSRERRSGRMEESPERWRREKKEDFESNQRRRRSGRNKSRSRERSKDGKESSFDHVKLRSSPGKDPGNRNKDISNKLKETNSVKADNDGSKKEKETVKEKNKTETKTGAKAKRISKDENLVKNEKTELEKFSTKSPLDALYSEMIISKTSSRFSKLGSGVTKSEYNIEESTFAISNQKEPSPVEKEEDEDWTLSFKNERRDTDRPMTLYSKRMMQKLTETKKVEKMKAEEKADPKPTEINNVETEKEPGELTDEENIIESTKEFQELTKVAIIESVMVEKGEECDPFKEPLTKEVVKNKPEAVEAAEMCKKDQAEIRDVIEFSPFKNNYRLIEISPIKPPDKEQLMEMYNKRTSTGQIQKEVESSIFNLLSSLSGIPVASKTEGEETKGKENKQPAGEKQTEEQVLEKSDEKIVPKSKSRKNIKCSKKSEKEEKSTGEESKSEKSDEMDAPGEATQFLDFFLLTTSPSKQIIPGHLETPGKMQNDGNLSDPKVNSSSETIEGKNSISSREINEEEMKKTRNESEKQGQKKQDRSKDCKKKENENKTDGKSQKRKRESESEPESKKRKRESGSESESKKTKSQISPRKRTRSQNANQTKPEPKPETKVKEDITTFEFFKPIAKKDNSDTGTECKMTTMSVANIVCLETPNKGVKNLMINEQMIVNVLDAKNPALCSPLMTPRRLLKNDLMLTDSEDDSGNKGNVGEEEEEDEEEEEEMCESENSECGSDSGASDFVDLL